MTLINRLNNDMFKCYTVVLLDVFTTLRQYRQKFIVVSLQISFSSCIFSLGNVIALTFFMSKPKLSYFIIYLLAVITNLCWQK